MDKSSFVHLHVHTHYSLLKSSCTVSGLVDRCMEYNQEAIAITDYANMFGVLDLYFSAKDKGIKPILGLEIYLAPGSLTDKNPEISGFRKHNNHSLVLIAQDMEGYRNLCRINTTAFQEGFYYVPRVDYATLAKYNQSVMALTGGITGELVQSYLRKGPDPALQVLRKLKEIYKDRLYIELNRLGVGKWDQINTFLMEAGHKESIPLIAANNVHYLKQKDHLIQDVLSCIGTNRTLQDRDRDKLESDQLYLKSSQEMRELFKDIPEACDSTLECSSRCHVEFQTKRNGRTIYHLPKLKISEGDNPRQELKELSLRGLKQRWEELKNQGKILSDSDKKKYRDRLEKEIKIITSRGFTDYFLIIYDFVHWARKQTIPVGPGRGSGASSLVAYSLKITDLDPMPYNLLFERFLNPERISLPDFDVDFCQEHRNRVIDYVTNKYGKDYVAQVMTYGRLQARAATRDVGRVLGMRYEEVDQVVKLIPERLGITLDDAVKSNDRLSELMDADPQINTLINMARQIEGLIRHVSIHAAGVIIADQPILSYAPLYRGAEGENIIQCDLHHSKKIGLVKFDFLGLKTLTQIRSAFELINANTNKNLSEKDISLEDKGIYEVMCRGDTKGVFQFEGEGITDLIIRAQPSCFEDIVAINALFRPGPMEMIPSYLDRKKGRVQVEYIFPELEHILKETYGIIVYQEQVLLIAAKVAGYSYGEADVLRRAMGEKKPSVMKKQKSRFLTGAEKNNYDSKKAEKLFDLVAEFAKYGFNKSHAAAYCVLAAQTAWLKKYYPVEFFASLLTVEINNTDKMLRYVVDARKHGIQVLPPHINHSEYFFTSGKNCIYFSLGAIKGVGRAAVDEILSVRNQLKDKKFRSVQQFFETVDIKKFNKKTVEALVKAGAFENMGMNNQEILYNYEGFSKQMDQKKEERESGQINLFSSQGKEELFLYKKYPGWTRTLKLHYERSVIGFYLSGHPLDYLESFRSVLSCKPIASLDKEGHRSSVCVWGILDQLREVQTRKGATMAFAYLEDNTGSLPVVLFSDVYVKFEKYIRSGKVLLVKGVMNREKNNSEDRLIVQELAFIDERLGQSKRVIVHLTEQEKSQLPALKQVLSQHTGEVPLYFSVKLNEKKSIPLKLNLFRGVSVSMQFLEKIQKTVGGTKKIQIF